MILKVLPHFNQNHLPFRSDSLINPLINETFKNAFFLPTGPHFFQLLVLKIMVSPHKLKAAILVTFLFFTFADPSFARDAMVANVRLNNTRDHLLIYLNIEGAFTKEMEKAILSGVPASFTYYIQCHRLRDFWFDQELKDIKTIHTIRYDNLKKEFYITRAWENSAPFSTKSFNEAKLFMTQISGLELIKLEKLDKGAHYQILTKAELGKITLPFYLHYVLFFVSMWDFETDWHSTVFIYP